MLFILQCSLEEGASEVVLVEKELVSRPAGNMVKHRRRNSQGCSD